MKRLVWFGLLCIPLGLHAAEMYRWVGPSGVTHYSDSLPPAGVQQASRLSGEAASGNSGLTTQERPAVVLYAFACGPLCDDAKVWLGEQGIAYTLKDPQQDPEAAAELKKLIGVLEAPALKVGDKSFKGFEPNAWGRMLSAAGYSVGPAASKK